MNSTLREVSENERILQKVYKRWPNILMKGMAKLKECSVSSTLLTVNEHAMQLDRALTECRREYETFIEAIVNSQNCILQPHIVTPAQIIKQMKTNQADMPSDHSLPIPVSAIHQNLLLRITDINVFTKDSYLVYVIRLPLTNHVKYNIYHVLPLPIGIKDTDSKFIFILPESISSSTWSSSTMPG
jgi:hypothetical protein